MMVILFAMIFSYLLGSICSAVIVSKLFSLPDPRTTGSNNPGATNVLRLAGKKYAALVLLCDLLKGFFPVILFKALGINPNLLGLICLAAVLGHIFPIFFNFKGGKGVATTLGVLLGLNLTLGISVIFTWCLVAKLSNYSSLAAIISIICAPFYALLILHNYFIFLTLLLLTIIICICHRKNISRLINGKEPTIKSK